MGTMARLTLHQEVVQLCESQGMAYQLDHGSDSVGVPVEIGRLIGTAKGHGCVRCNGVEDGVSAAGKNGADSEGTGFPFSLPGPIAKPAFAARSYPDEEAWAEACCVNNQLMPSRALGLLEVRRIGGVGGV